jgi:hypothetical protein
MLDHIGQFKSALEGDSTNRVAFHGLGFVSLEARTCPLRVNTVARMLTEHRAFYRTLVLIFPPQWRVWLTMRLGPELLLNPQHYVRVQFDRSAAVVSHKTLTTRHADGETGRWDICAEQDLNKQCRQHISQQGFAQSVVASKLEAQGFHAQPAQPVMYAAPQMPSAASAATAEQVRDSLRAAERGAADPGPLDGYGPPKEIRGVRDSLCTVVTLLEKAGVALEVYAEGKPDDPTQEPLPREPLAPMSNPTKQGHQVSSSSSSTS